MDGRSFDNLEQAGEMVGDDHSKAPSAIGRDLKAIVLLLCVAAGMRAWLITHTEVAARDSIGFIRYAVQLERQSWLEVFRHNEQHPGYPILLLAASKPVRYFLGGATPFSMQLSAQIASAFASLLLVIPMFYLGRAVFNSKVAFWATLTFQCLPVAAHVLADGLSEATFLLFMITGLLAGVLALRTFSLFHFICCGVCGGLAYLTRPEGVLLPLAALLVLPLAGLAHRPRLAWRRIASHGASLALAAIIVGGPFAFAIGGFTSKPTPLKILNLDDATNREQQPETDGRTAQRHAEVPAAKLSCSESATLLAVYAPPGLHDLTWWPFKAIGVELLKGYEYFLCLPLLFGVWLFRKQIRSSPGLWLMMAVCALDIVLLWRLGKVVGYISERHVLLLVLCGLYPAAAGCIVLSQWLAAFVEVIWRSLRSAAPFRKRQESWVAAGCLIALTMFALPGALKTLHVNRAGHRQAGLWLAQHSEPVDSLLDPYCWAHYHSGRLFLEGAEPKAPPSHVTKSFIVIEHSKSDHIRLEVVPLAEKLATYGTNVYRWPENSSEASAKILIYELEPPAQGRAYEEVLAHPVKRVAPRDGEKRSKTPRLPDAQRKT